ncbi:MAG: outer membrane lipoprotein carrier protein LolA [Candidatus Kapabacteria bacterium]|nr:outer membrane lipoprotein carrier protein LolA [Candidatus Kapabacteria bacterium]
MIRRSVTMGIVALASSALMHASQFGERFHTTYASLRSLSCTFTDASGIRGSVSAVKGGKYDIKLPDRRIVSNGTTVWNITPSSKTVIINAMNTNSEDLSIERVFFTLMAVYRIQNESKPDARKHITLRLVPPAPSAVVGGVVWADVTVDASMNVETITIHDGASTTRWAISRLKRNRPIDASVFTFTPANDWQVIDLR